MPIPGLRELTGHVYVGRDERYGWRAYKNDRRELCFKIECQDHPVSVWKERGLTIISTQKFSFDADKTLTADDVTRALVYADAEAATVENFRTLLRERRQKGVTERTRLAAYHTAVMELVAFVESQFSRPPAARKATLKGAAKKAAAD